MKSKAEKVRHTERQSTDCNVFGLDIQGLRTGRLERGQIVQNELGCNMNNFWSNGKKCQNAKVNLMPGNTGKSVGRQTQVIYRKG